MTQSIVFKPIILVMHNAPPALGSCPPIKPIFTTLKVGNNALLLPCMHCHLKLDLWVLWWRYNFLISNMIDSSMGLKIVVASTPKWLGFSIFALLWD